MTRILEVIIFIALVVCYYNAPMMMSASYIALVIGLACCSYALLYYNQKTSIFFKNHFISNSGLFLLMFSIVCFQFPIDFVLGNDTICYERYFYNLSTINLSVTFDALCFVSFVLGILSSKTLQVEQTVVVSQPCDEKNMPVKPLLRLMYLLWVGYIAFLNPDYVKGGHGSIPINGISVALYNYYWRINIIYLAIQAYNHGRFHKLKIIEAVRVLPRMYYITIIISMILFFMAHNRVYVFYLLTPLLFYILVVTRIKSKPIPSLLFICAAGIFFTLFKLFGIENMFTEGTIRVSEYDNYDRFSSFSPFTSELASSILADSALFYIWLKNGVVVVGSTIVIGVLRSFSGLIPLFYFLTGLSSATYDSASFVTTALGADYGLGSCVSGDLIVSVGFVGALIIMFLFGKLCCYSDQNLFTERMTFKVILVGMCISAQVVFLVRASLADTIATLIFCFVFYGIYKKMVTR